MGELSGLAERVRESVSWTVDTDEVAALLESTGMNDRLAHRRYGYSTVFALAREVHAEASVPGVPPPPARGQPAVARDILVRAALYLTPTAVAIGIAPHLGNLPWYATTGLLVAGWGSAQALAYLG